MKLNGLTTETYKRLNLFDNQPQDFLYQIGRERVAERGRGEWGKKLNGKTGG